MFRSGLAHKTATYY